MHFGRSATLTFWNRIADIGLSSTGQLVLLALISRRLGADGLGSWQALFQVFSLIQLFELGCGQGVVKLLSRHQERGDWTAAWRSSAASLWATGALVCAGGLAATFISPRLMPLPDQAGFQLGLGLLSVWCLFRFRLTLGVRAGYATNEIVYSSSIDALVSASRPWFASAALLLGGGFIAIPVSYILAEACAYTLSWMRLPARLQPLPDGRRAPGLSREIWSFGIANGLISMAAQACGYLQPLLIGHTLGLRQLTAYTCAMALVGLVCRVGYIPASIAYPHLLQAAARGEFRAGNQLRSRAVLLMVPLLVAACAAYALLCAPVVTRWVGPEHTVDLVVSSLMGLSVATYVAQDYLLMLTRVHHRTMWRFGMLSLLQTAIVVGLTAPASRHFGLVGAISVLLVSHLCGITWFLLALRAAPHKDPS